MRGRFEDAQICCDGGVYRCDECGCEVEPDDYDHYHLCDECLSQRPFYLNLTQALHEGWDLETDDKFCDEPPHCVKGDESTLYRVYEQATNGSKYHQRALLLTMGHSNEQIDKLYENRTTTD